MHADEIRNLYIGQSFDLYWTYHVECPTVEQHLKMIDNSAYNPPISPCHDEILSGNRNGWALPLALEAHVVPIDGKP